MAFPDNLNPDKLPRHIAIIMDGNGRWARKQGKIRTFGHKSAVEAVKDTVEAAAEIGIEVLTLYAFSTENWNRPRYEVNALMTLLVTTIHKEVKRINENNIRLMAIGDIDSLPSRCRDELNEAIRVTAGNTRMTLVLALSYSGRWEITRAVKQIALEIAAGTMKPDQINEDLLASRLTTAGFPDPELLIRSSGEHRISNFLLWQIAYSELYFTDKLWPDFRRQDLVQAIYDFQNRERRFGMTSEQVAEEKA
jgi:undecaprenyl diphosphate synthase